jgi:hypothetical protein
MDAGQIDADRMLERVLAGGLLAPGVAVVSMKPIVFRFQKVESAVVV